MDGHAIDAQVGSKILLEGNYFNNVRSAFYLFLQLEYLIPSSGEDSGAAFDWSSVCPRLRRRGFRVFRDDWKEVCTEY